MSVHDDLVKDLVANLRGESYTKIRADLEGYDQPTKIHWSKNPNEKFIPDATAIKNNVPFIFEVETADSIGIEHSDAQWRLFAAHAKSKRGHFIIYVQDGAELEAKKRIAELKIDADVW